MTSLEQKIDLVKSCQLVITDTYHCAITAWREGVPCLCIGRGAETAVNTQSEKKKELLYAMFNATPFYIFLENLGGFKAREQAKAAISAARDEWVTTSVQENVLRATGAAEEQLLAAFSSLARE